MTDQRHESGALARARALACGAPHPEDVTAVTIGDGEGRTVFTYDDGRDPWVLPGLVEVEK